MKKSVKLFGFLVLALMLSFSLTSIVSAYAGTNFGIGESVKAAYQNWNLGVVDPAFSKILIFILIFFIVFLVLESIWGEKAKSNRWIIIAISVVIAIMATAYMVPAEVIALMQSYDALGLTITTLIPLALLIGFSFNVARGEGNLALVMIQNLAWWLFLAYTVYKFILGINDDAASFTVAIIILIATIFSFLAAVWNKDWLGLLEKRVTDATIAAANRRRRLATAHERGEASAEEDLAGR